MTAGRAFVKMHGLRNHFAIVDARADAFEPGIDDIVRICDPRVGVGADQLIVIEPSDAADAFMRIYNTDGRQAEACGNATRCVAWLLLEERRADAVVVETLAGRLHCERAGDRLVGCEMGPVSGDWRKVPLAEARDTRHVDVGDGPLRDGVAVSVGNPHVVFFVDDLTAVDVAALAPAIQRDPLFPQQVNVGVASVKGPAALELVVYERGAGLTMACGSGACAAAFAARERGLMAANTVTVTLPGGDLDVSLDDEGRAKITGPVAHCFRGELP